MIFNRHVDFAAIEEFKSGQRVPKECQRSGKNVYKNAPKRYVQVKKGIQQKT